MLIRIVAFPGSSRPDSLRQMLIDRGITRALEAGAEVKSVYTQHAELSICVDDCEFEDEVLPSAGNTREEMSSHHILLIATPENSGDTTSRNKKLLGWADHLIRGALSGLNRMVSGLTGALFALARWLGTMRSHIPDPCRTHKSQAKRIVDRRCE